MQPESDSLFCLSLRAALVKEGIMDKPLHILQKSVNGVPTGISLDMSLNVDREDGFAEGQIVGLSAKIPLVKPYFKKKQRKLDPKCLHHALEDPILTTLLSTDSLVSGDGMFVPHNRPGRTPGTLCTAAVTKKRLGTVSADQDVSRAGVPGLVTRDRDVEIADTSVELEETRQQTEPKIGDPIPDEHCFQPKPVVRAAGNKAATSPGRDVPPVVASQTPHQEGGVLKHALLTSVAKTLPVKDCSSVQESHPLDVQPDKGVLFQDKSEEASLDLVFELLTQLQYHTHQSDSVDICVDFLQGRCVYGNDCAHHHTVLPYHWQIHKSGSQTWQSIADDSQEQLERLFCNPDNEHATLKFQ